MPPASDQPGRRFGTPVDANLDGIPDEIGLDFDNDGRVDGRAPVVSFRGEHFVHVGSSKKPNLRQLMSDASIASSWFWRMIGSSVLVGIIAFWIGWYSHAAVYGSGLAVVPPLPESKLAGEVEKAIRGAPYSWIAGLEPPEQRELLAAWKADREARRKWEDQHDDGARK